MKNALRLAVLGIVSAVGTAAVADGPGRYSIKDTPVMAGYNWTGGYFGVHAGYGWGDSKLTENLPALGIPLPTLSSSHEVDGFLGGVQLGARRQFGSFVIGAELSLSGANITGSGGNCLGIETLLGAPPGLLTSTCKTEVNWLATALGKAGFAFDKFLIYGAAGWSVAGVTNNFTLSIPIIPVSISSAQNDVMDGFTIGGGMEYAFGNGLSLGLEYLYRDLEVKGEGLLLGGIITTGKRELEMHSISAALNVKF